MEAIKPFPEKITIGEKYGPAMTITDAAKAHAYFEACVVHTMTYGNPKPDRAEAERIERANLGYYAGYYDAATREQVERVFSCAHPVFGTIRERGNPDARAGAFSGFGRRPR